MAFKHKAQMNCKDLWKISCLGVITHNSCKILLRFKSGSRAFGVSKRQCAHSIAERDVQTVLRLLAICFAK